MKNKEKCVKSVYCPVKVSLRVLNVDCPVENRGKVLIYTLKKLPPILFIGCKLRKPGIKIEATD